LRLLLTGPGPLAGHAEVSVRAARRNRVETLPKCSEIFRILDNVQKTREWLGSDAQDRLRKWAVSGGVNRANKPAKAMMIRRGLFAWRIAHRGLALRDGALGRSDQSFLVSR
jgi:hypothetical protein